jgi:hypothetical protein
MTTPRYRSGDHDPEAAGLPLIPGDVQSADPPAWEQIAAGRYMPRRIRGSNRGRVLG